MYFIETGKEAIPLVMPALVQDLAETNLAPACTSPDCSHPQFCLPATLFAVTNTHCLSPEKCGRLQTEIPISRQFAQLAWAHPSSQSLREESHSLLLIHFGGGWPQRFALSMLFLIVAIFILMELSRWNAQTADYESEYHDVITTRCARVVFDAVYTAWT